MNYIFLIIVIFIILLFIYFYYLKFNNKLEKFDNTQSSLSTYYQNNVDEDNYKTNKNLYNKVKPNTKKIISLINKWDGIWRSPASNINSQIIAVNDILLIAFGNSNLTEFISQNNTKNNYDCAPNLFLGIGQLNIQKTNFILKKVLCNNYVNQSLNFVVNGMSGYITNNTITLYSSNNSITIELIKTDTIIFDSDSFYKQSNFLKLFSPFIKNYPIMTRSTYSLTNSICENSSECKVTNMGLGDAFENSDMNACGNPVSKTDNTCNGRPKCIFYSPAPDGYTTCNITNTINDYMNFSGLNLMSSQNKDTLEACSYLNYFGKNGFNSCIVCYVSNYNTVHTLNYQFFGVSSHESTLTLQKDVLHDILLNDNGLVKIYRNKIASGSGDPSTILSLSNCIELNNTSGTPQQIIQQSLSNCNQHIKPLNKNKKSNLKPTVWQINYDIDKNYINSCSFSLSTSKFYKLAVKYANFNENQTTNLSLYGGDYRQNIILENSTILNNNDKIIIMSTNLKINNGLYLVPNIEKGGFSNDSNLLSFRETPFHDGKWLIIGFNLKDINDLDNYLNSDNLTIPINKKMILDLSGPYTSIPITDDTNKCQIINNGNVVLFNDIKRGMVFSFNGSSTYLSTNISAVSNFTKSLWLYNNIITKLTNVCYSGNNFLIQVTSESKLYVGINDTTNTWLELNSGSVKQNTWFHLVVTMNNNMVYSYINGNLTSSINISNGINTDNLSRYIGGWYDFGMDVDFIWNGYISNIQEYNIALSGEEILNLYQLQNI